MSEFKEFSGGAAPWNTKTQMISIAEQLRHYGYGAGAWHGGNGQSLDTTIDEINDFTANNNGLIILDISHGYDTDNWAGEFDSGLDQDQWDEVFTDRGIYNRIRLNVYNEYSNEDDQRTMINGQLSKLKTIQRTPTSQMFALSWTLTQSDIADVLLVDIVKAAEGVNRALPELLWPELTREMYPNVLFIDAYPDDGDVAALAEAINLFLARSC
ncbi:hypothetical protein T440DRAFT_519078 [Plenodomus tracheiphilus IPT5]|uniref:Uncharacterized protein n=1 Tax=Plenodomus tracheiphilus IPT5 TaxID=1408161 RepID=A0A6A7B1X1_9PLEO|nr:hypothetical protein T440DRAFT_519078 [Plenodomus tracheiphilus IPT5]